MLKEAPELGFACFWAGKMGLHALGHTNKKPNKKWGIGLGFNFIITV
jgi:hypothetical protein